MKPAPPIRVWREPIDGTMVAIIAWCFTIKRRGLYGAATFLIVEYLKAYAWNFDWEAAGKEHFKTVLMKENEGRLPYLGYAESETNAPFHLACPPGL